jgi:hypothetical protein
MVFEITLTSLKRRVIKTIPAFASIEIYEKSKFVVNVEEAVSGLCAYARCWRETLVSILALGSTEGYHRFLLPR